MKSIPIGRLLRGSVKGFVIGCTVDEVLAPHFGGMVRVPLDEKIKTVGMIYDIQVADDGLVRQLAGAAEVAPSTIQDAQINRNVPLEISVLSLGYFEGDQISHRLPPRPPLSLDVISLCASEDMRGFTGRGYGYFRHLLHDRELPLADLLAVHLPEAAQVHPGEQAGSWLEGALRELTALLQDDYDRLMRVMNAVQEQLPRDEHGRVK